jgi:hypothetical protein
VTRKQQLAALGEFALRGWRRIGARRDGRGAAC